MVRPPFILYQENPAYIILICLSDLLKVLLKIEIRLEGIRNKAPLR